MNDKTFKALVVREGENDQFPRTIETRRISDLPDNEVLIKVEYSSLNFKDALSATGVRRVTPRYPHTPGIDAAGTVIESANPSVQAGDEVLVTGYDLGMSTPGGYGQYISVPAAWVVKRPSGLSAREAMIYGTAGFTAGLSVLKLQRQGVQPSEGPVLVTGASGGVGSLAVSTLTQAGYEVAAASGKPGAESLLREVGAKHFLAREELDDRSGRILLEERWPAVVDTVGGNILASALRATRYGGTVTACGWAAGADVPANMHPFMNRGVSLIGVDSVQCPMSTRLQVWEKLGGDWKSPHLERLCTEVALEEVSPLIDKILQGELTGRYIVNLNT